MRWKVQMAEVGEATVYLRVGGTATKCGEAWIVVARVGAPGTLGWRGRGHFHCCVDGLGKRALLG